MLNSAAHIFDKHARLYQDKYMDVSRYHHSFDQFCAAVTTAGAQVLEIACGPGNITQYLLQNRPDFQLLGTDVSANMVALAAINNPSATFRVMDARDISQINRQFDAVLCGFGLPYWSPEEAEHLIADVAGLLHPNGILYLSTMEENDHHQSGIKTSSAGDQLYMYYHQATHLTGALEKNGFDLLSLHRQEYPEPDGFPATDLLLIARKKQ